MQPPPPTLPEAREWRVHLNRPWRYPCIPKGNAIPSGFREPEEQAKHTVRQVRVRPGPSWPAPIGPIDGPRPVSFDASQRLPARDLAAWDSVARTRGSVDQRSMGTGTATEIAWLSVENSYGRKSLTQP